jgi:hypothetical protein
VMFPLTIDDAVFGVAVFIGSVWRYGHVVVVGGGIDDIYLIAVSGQKHDEFMLTMTNCIFVSRSIERA